MAKEVIKITKKDDENYEIEFEDKNSNNNYIFVPNNSNCKSLKLVVRKFISDENEKIKLDLSNERYETINENAFANDSFISEIKLPKSLKTIEKEAFKNCKSLKIVQFECEKRKSELTIQTQALKDCEKLESVIFGEISSFKKIIIEKGAFEGCSSLRTVYLNSTDCEISEDGFSGADNLILAVKGNTSAEHYAREKGIKYVRF